MFTCDEQDPHEGTFWNGTLRFRADPGTAPHSRAYRVGALSLALPCVAPLDPQNQIVPFARGNKELAIFLIFILSIVAGLIIEDIDSRIERVWIDGRNARRVDLNLDPIWEAYLVLRQAPTGDLAVMPGYNSSLVVRMKFELSLGIALIFTCAGLAMLWLAGQLHMGAGALLLLFASNLGAVAYLLWETVTSCMVLHRNRVLMLMADGVLPPDYALPDGAVPIAAAPAACMFIAEAGCCEQCSTTHGLVHRRFFHHVPSARRMLASMSAVNRRLSIHGKIPHGGRQCRMCIPLRKEQGVHASHGRYPAIDRAFDQGRSQA